MKQINTYPFSQRNDMNYITHYKKLSEKENKQGQEIDKSTLLKMEESKMIGDIFSESNNRYNYF